MKSLGSQTITATDTHSGGFTGTVHVSVSTSVYGYYTWQGHRQQAQVPVYLHRDGADRFGQSQSCLHWHGTLHQFRSPGNAASNTTITGGAGTFSATLRQQELRQSWRTIPLTRD